MENSKTEVVRIANVLIDSVGLSRVFSYSIPERYLERIGIGSYVTIPLGRSRARGWVVGIDSGVRANLAFDLVPIFRLLGGGPSPDVIALCKWSAWRFCGSPVSFLTHASPRKRIASVPGGSLSYGDCDEPVRLARGTTLLVRIPPTHSRVEWLKAHIGLPGALEGQVLIVCPTQRIVEIIRSGLAECGFSVAMFPEQFESARDLAQVVVGARNACFASVANLKEIVVIDADDPSHVEEASPVWNSADVVRARVRPGQSAILLSSAPTSNMVFGAEVLSLERTQERSGWPKIFLHDIAGTAEAGQIVNSVLADHIRLAVGSVDGASSIGQTGLIKYEGVVVLYNRLGGARTLVCTKCSHPVTCVNCSSTLMQVQPEGIPDRPESRGEINELVKQQMRVGALLCPTCKEKYPAICTRCLSISLRVVSFGIKRLKALLEGALGIPVSEIDASSEVSPASLGRVLVATEAVFSKLSSAKMVVIADFDHYAYRPSMGANELALSILARAARLLPPRSAETRYVPMFVQSRDVDNLVLKAAMDGDPRRVNVEEMRLRRQLSLPPFGALVRISGKRAAAWLEASGLAESMGFELAQTDDEVFEIRSKTTNVLLDELSSARAKFSARLVRFEVNAP